MLKRSPVSGIITNDININQNGSITAVFEMLNHDAMHARVSAAQVYNYYVLLIVEVMFMSFFYK